MKRSNILYISLFFISIIGIVGCKKLEIENVLAGITPISINFIRADSTIVKQGDCVNPYEKYMVAIEIKINEPVTGMPKTVGYTINDSAYKVDFITSGKKYFPIILKQGLNKIQLNATELKDSIRVVYQEFELVN
jgi:hypothetical protein